MAKTRSLSAFSEKSQPPTDRDLRLALGTAYEPWSRLRAMVANRIGPVDDVWGFTSASTGWGLRLRQKDRVIVYMTPQRDQFLVSFALGEKAVAAARDAKLSAAVWHAIDVAPRYAEGRGVRFEVTNSRPLASLAALAQIKWQN
jgi:hypothetical protein